MNLPELNICPEPTLPLSAGVSDGCDCPPEEYCVAFCGEGYTISTPISWQHFPRSTSSRSRCDDSSEEVRKSITETVTPSVKEEEAESSKPSGTVYPITATFSQLNALHYLNVRHVFELLNFLIGHLVCNEPEDPVPFLVDILDQCLKFRESFGEPPLLFTHAHVQSLYTAFDPFERGHITMEQYREAMKTLGLANGITPYNEEPPLDDDGYVEQNNFVFEAERCLHENLKKMIRVPKIWEENRLLWEKKRSRRKKKPPPPESDVVSECYEGEYKSSNSVAFNKSLCNYFNPPKNSSEIEQMFLDACPCSQ